MPTILSSDHTKMVGSAHPTRLLLAHADVALRRESDLGQPAISPQKVLRTIRQELQSVSGGRQPCPRRRLQTCRASRSRANQPESPPRVALPQAARGLSQNGGQAPGESVKIFGPAPFWPGASPLFEMVPPHEPLKPPKLKTLSDKQKLLLQQHLQAA